MKSFSNGGFLVEEDDALPDLKGKVLFCDLENTSQDVKVKALNPWDVDHCRIWVMIIAVDDGPAYAIPRQLIDLDWLERVVNGTETWCNHHVKYDAHVLANDFGIVYEGELECTLNSEKLVHSDRTFTGGYALDALAKSVLKEDIGGYEDVMAPWLVKNKDYGNIPLDLLAEYGCQDLITARRLRKTQIARMPEDGLDLWETEKRLTGHLFRMERHGLKISLPAVRKRLLIDSHRMIAIADELEERLGYEMNPSSSDDCFDLLCNRFGLPPVYPADKDNPTFKDFVLSEYRALPNAPVGLIDLIREYRKHSIHVGLFWNPWLELEVDGRIHVSFNQNVRSGRMGCRQPNFQQLDEYAKECVEPDEGMAFVSCDYSQVEFRLTGHFTQDFGVIERYREDPDADYHAVVADMCSIPRKPAKNVNFMLAFGGGRNKCVAMLRASAEIITEDMTREEIDARAESVFDKYHQMLPGLKRKSRKAARIARRFGYVKNPYGRRSQIPYDRSRVAFNRVVQGTAADVMKERAVAVCEDPTCIRRNWRLVCLVHDEFLFQVPIADVEEASSYLPHFLCQVPIKFRIPIRSSCGSSDETWAKAK